MGVPASEECELMVCCFRKPYTRPMHPEGVGHMALKLSSAEQMKLAPPRTSQSWLFPAAGPLPSGVWGIKDTLPFSGLLKPGQKPEHLVLAIISINKNTISGSPLPSLTGMLVVAHFSELNVALVNGARGVVGAVGVTG
eukprot:CAMPEP_0184314198 /NCGR_PEP_ID=MMETSP1049-20130417/72222_1 /TAXON_ID=77928 /ORGANISM="Proteomonas sulcata, Strain CCMP704" /LENGTH=138 /DNA_ID=CAMNT_0026631993 /DNA_START=263 /DNA_END=677 /DNA_ORIENTATION=+